MHKEQRVLRASLGAASRTAKRSEAPADLERVDNLRREYRTAALEDYIKRTVDAAPPLAAADRERLATLLRGGQDG